MSIDDGLTNDHVTIPYSRENSQRWRIEEVVRAMTGEEGGLAQVRMSHPSAELFVSHAAAIPGRKLSRTKTRKTVAPVLDPGRPRHRRWYSLTIGRLGGDSVSQLVIDMRFERGSRLC